MRFTSFGSRFGAFSAIVAGLALAACSATDGGGASTAKAPAYTASDFAVSTYCPPLQIRSRTESLTLYERGREEEPAHVRYLASILKTARECQMAGNTLVMKIGVSGRVVSGPKGGAGTVNLPLRIVIVKQVGGTGPLFTKLYKFPVNVPAPALSADYTQVFEQVSVNIAPDDRNLIVYVGFDEGPQA